MCGTRDCCKSNICSIHCRQMGRGGGYCSYAQREDRCICYCYKNQRFYQIESSENFQNSTSCKADECFYDDKCYSSGEPLNMDETKTIRCIPNQSGKVPGSLLQTESYCNSGPCDFFCAITYPVGKAARCSCEAYGPYDPYIPKKSQGLCYCA